LIDGRTNPEFIIGFCIVAFPNPHLVLLVFGAGFSGEEKGGGGTVGGELGSGPVLCHVSVNSHIYGM